MKCLKIYSYSLPHPHTASSRASLSEDHDIDLDGMMVSEQNATYIKPFSQERLEIVWKPTVPGRCDAQFILAFEDEMSEDVSLISIIMI